MSSRPATPWLREGWGRVHAVEGLSVLSPAPRARPGGPCTALQIVHAPETPPPGTLAGRCVNAGNLPLASGFSWKQKVVHSYSWALGTQPGQVHSST